MARSAPMNRVAVGVAVGLATIGALAWARSAFAAPALEAPVPPTPSQNPTVQVPKTPIPANTPSPAPASKSQPGQIQVPGFGGYILAPEETLVHGFPFFHTPPEYAEIDRTGKVKSAVGTVTALPLRDSRNGLFARLTYRDAAIVAAKLGGQLLSTQEQDALAKEGLMLTPCTLQAGNMMASMAWAAREDECIVKQLADLGFDYANPVVVNNAGKEWIRGAPPGRAINRGWYDKSAKYGMIQTSGGRHDENHTDYSQLTRVIWS